MVGTSKVSTRAILLTFLALGVFQAFRTILNGGELSLLLDPIEVSDEPIKTATAKPPKTTVAYAATVTHFEPSLPNTLLDRAAVLHQSIKVAMQKSQAYDYHLYAFVHTNASNAKPFLEQLGYRVQIKETPFNITEIDNFDLVDGQRIGCCGEREYLKLYSYLLLDYPVVVHLDLDTIVLRPMDDLFDFMALSQSNKLSVNQVESFARTSAMWMTNRQNNVTNTHASRLVLQKPERIDFMYTRDYNMVDPPYLKPYQMGVQGGFLVLRPNRRDFDRMVNILQKGGGGYKHSMWGYEELKNNGYGGFYGAATIQGLASYYYDHYEKGTRSIELNRCYYNTMVDAPQFFNQDMNQSLCRTLEEECQDCRETNFKDIYTAHLTVCGKPEWCHRPPGLCGMIISEWHKIRLALEMEWMQGFSSSAVPYVPRLEPNQDGDQPDLFLGHCKGWEYIPLTLPTLATLENSTESLI